MLFNQGQQLSLSFGSFVLRRGGVNNCCFQWFACCIDNGDFAACAVCRVKRKHNFSADGRLQKKLFEVFAKNANSRFLCLFR